MATDYFDYVLDGVPEVDTTDWGEVAELLEQSQEQERQRLERELAQIEQQLADRDQIHQELTAELKSKTDRYTDQLKHLYTIGKGKLDGTRERLKDRIVSFYQELRDEQRAHWRDRQNLEQERREVRREHDAVTDESLSELL